MEELTQFQNSVWTTRNGGKISKPGETVWESMHWEALDTKLIGELLGLGVIDSDQLHGVPEEALLNAACGRFFSQQFTEYCGSKIRVSNNIAFRRALANNPATPIALLENLANDDEYIVRLDLGKNISTPPSILSGLVPGCVALVSTQPRLVPFVSSKGYLNLSKNPASPIDLLKGLSIHQDYAIRAGVARNFSTPAHILEGLAADPHADVRMGTANHPFATPSLLEFLASDECDDIQLSVARHRLTPSTTLLNLAYRNEKFRVQSLSMSRRYSLAIAVASNPGSPTEALEILSSVAEEFSTFGKDLIAAVSANPSSPFPLLIKISKKYSDNVIQEAIAANASLPDDLIEEFALSKSVEVRRAVALNPKTDQVVLRSLMDDPNKLVKAIVMCRIGGEDLANFIEDAHYRVLTQAVEATKIDVLALEKFAQAKNPMFRVIAASHSDSTEEMLCGLAEDKDCLVSLAVMRNPNTPSSVCQTIGGKQFYSFLDQFPLTPCH
jgi:hypothetical protein